MTNNLIKSIFYKNKLEILKDRKLNYEIGMYTNEQIIKFQLEKFNKIWENAYRNIPFYKSWKSTYNLPDKIDTISELNNFPVLTKKDIQINKDLIFKNLENYNTISTGGSSGEPTIFPTNKEESEFLFSNIYIGRSWWNIEPLDSTVLYWGHSHLFGSGFKGKINELKRKLADKIINIKRFNAYDMSIDTLKKYLTQLKKENPCVIIGYTSTIYKLAKYVKDLNENIGIKTNLKAVIVTSETVSDADIKLIEDVFKVPCVIEYGMAEAGVISYSKDKSLNMQVFWDSFIAIKDTNDTLLITTLYNKIFPLINYRTDDCISIKEEFETSIIKFNKILGRKKDILRVGSSDGKLLEFSGILMVHLLKSYPNLYEISFKQIDDKRIKINYTSSCKIDNINLKSYFLENLSSDHDNLDADNFIFENVDKIEKTVAGKIKLIED